MSWTDAVALAVALLVLYLPGLLLARICLRADGGWTAAVGLAPAVSAGVVAVTALATGALGVRFGLPAYALATVVLAAGLWLLTGRPSPRVLLGGRVRLTPAGVGGVVLTLAAVASTAWSWLRGLDGLATPSQEHDTVQHTLITAFIARTGRAAPWQVAPRDYYDHSITEFYPAGLHSLSAVTANTGAGPVTALNATYLLFVCVVAPLGMYALAARLAPYRWRALAGGFAALVGATAYRPLYELSRDAGILSFAASLCLVAGILAAAPPFGRLRPRSVAPLALAVAGAMAVHTSIVVVLFLSVGLAMLVDLLGRRPALRPWLRQGGLAAAAAAVGLLISAPALLASRASASLVLDFPEDSPRWPLGDGLGRLLLFAHGGFTDPTYSTYSLAFAAVFYLGLLGCMWRRRAWPLLAVTAFWGLFFVAYGSGVGPGVHALSRFFYGSLNRIAGLPWLFAPPVAGAGLTLLLARGQLRLRRRSRTARHRAPALVTAAVLVAALLYGVTGVRDYVHRDDVLIAASYSDPELQFPYEAVRLTPGDLTALRWLADHRQDVGRIMNNANDGSTYGYVYYDLPLVNYATLGSAKALWGVELLEHFNRLGHDGRVDCLVQRYDVTHVFVSRTVPAIGAGGDPGNWVPGPLFRFAPGLEDLDRVEGLTVVYEDADATVYAVDRDYVRSRLAQEGTRC